MEDKLQVGVITSTHGVRGEVKVFPTTDDPNRFKRLKEVILDTGKEELVLEIEGVKFFKQFVILKFKGFDHINDIEINSYINVCNYKNEICNAYNKILVSRSFKLGCVILRPLKLLKKIIKSQK